MRNSSNLKDKSPKYDPTKTKLQPTLPPKNPQKESTLSSSNNKPSRDTKK